MTHTNSTQQSQSIHNGFFGVNDAYSLCYKTMDFSDLEENYENVEKYVKGICKGKFRSVIVNGPPGVGKTFSVDSYLKQHAQNGSYKVIAGHMTPLSLYGNLYQYRNHGDVLVLDDIDSVFSKIEGINLLKAAMDTKPIRRVNWESTSAAVLSLGLPQGFEFNGSIVLISNIGFSRKTNKLQEHLGALKDRSYSLQVSDGSNEALFQQVCFMVVKKGLLQSFNLSKQQESLILDYISDNIHSLHKISLRLAMKLASLMTSNPNEWISMADSGLLNETFE